MLFKISCVLVALAGCLGYGQTVDKSLTFDASSVKPAAPLVPDGRGRIMLMGPSGGPGTRDPGRIRYPFMSLRQLLVNAYDVKLFQLVGPMWLDSERFDITATMPPETTKEQFRVMLQNLMIERFKLAVHRETKEMQEFALSLAKGGPKMQESAPEEPKQDQSEMPTTAPDRPKIGPDGFPELPPGVAGRGGLFNIMMPGRARIFGRRATMQELVARLTNELSKPVANETGLTKKYDFTLTFSREGLPSIGMAMPAPPPPPPPGGEAGNPDNVFRPEGEAPPDLFHAVQSQLGLRLESKKGPVELIVIDHIEKTPTEN
jgi:uncharacterized protein (TIGR03435 family)